MAELTKQEELERVQRSVRLAEERISAINERLSGLENELEELILINETKGYKGRTIEKTQAEIDSLQKEKATLERTAEVLTKKLPELEKAARIEMVSTETLTAYQKAKNELLEQVNKTPSLAVLKAEIENIRQYTERLQEAQEGFFTLFQTVNDVLIKEDLQSIGDISIETLRSDKDGVNYQDLLAFSDNLIDVGETLNDLQYQIFKIGIATAEIKDPPYPHLSETCNCGLHRREFISSRNCWELWEHKQSTVYFGKWDWTLIHRDGGFDRKPEFPCEIKSTPEFSKDGKFQIQQKNSRWVLSQKNADGRWTKIKESRNREDITFPTETVAAVPEKKESKLVPGIIYENHDRQTRDPDKHVFNQ